MSERFSKTILEKTSFIRMKHNLHIVEQSNDYLKLSNSCCMVIVVYNKLGNACTLWLGRNDEKTNTVEIDNNVLACFFHSELRLSEVTKEVFVNNLVLFFENEADPLLSGAMALLNQLEKYDLERSRKYT
jgi:hypothetical protein